MTVNIDYEADKKLDFDYEKIKETLKNKKNNSNNPKRIVEDLDIDIV